MKIPDVDYLDGDDLVLSITYENLTRAYPTRILDRHEIVNDIFGKTPVAITYCPLCGSGLAFIRVLDGDSVQLGVSGLLHNNDLIMYDRKTESLWQQYVKKTYGDYDSSDRLLFPVTDMDARLHVKKVIYGVEIKGLSIAVEDEWLKKTGSWEHDVKGTTLRLDVDEAGGVTGSLGGQPLPVHRMYWFAWYSFHPDTGLIDKRNH